MYDNEDLKYVRIRLVIKNKDSGALIKTSKKSIVGFYNRLKKA